MINNDEASDKIMEMSSLVITLSLRRSRIPEIRIILRSSSTNTCSNILHHAVLVYERMRKPIHVFNTHLFALRRSVYMVHEEVFGIDNGGVYQPGRSGL